MNYWFLYTTATGEIYEAPYLGNATEWTNIPEGCAVLGPIDQSDPTATDAWQHPNHYAVQNGQLVKTVTDAQLLAEAQQARIAFLDQQLTATYNAGFTSSATGTSITWPFDDKSQIKWNWLLSVIAAGTFPASGVQVKDLAGNTYTITDVNVAKALCIDAQNFYLQWDSHYHSLVQQVQAATTVDQVDAITW
ncbi:hypothetical protein [Alicyclobacillus macrosporangiidus]|uniref:DUF4376 domain-containing protein n=1 Tax=Alicyclobacillus macrosporangiidus TaxID=392015 RepID=A0A1I7IEM8_9BACL|nr:hypothetical protein [Alicyclobacillus macrosporangiidus]SFU71368.1 hypothetical protein SAMN05421543_106174 [Alicyclobacillus macrosporangiidus]